MKPGTVLTGDEVIKLYDAPTGTIYEDIAGDRNIRTRCTDTEHDTSGGRYYDWHPVTEMAAFTPDGANTATIIRWGQE